MFFIARICSVVSAPPATLLCAGVSVVSMGVWLPGESLNPAMVIATGFRSLYLERNCDLVSVSQDVWRAGLFCLIPTLELCFLASGRALCLSQAPALLTIISRFETKLFVRRMPTWEADCPYHLCLRFHWARNGRSLIFALPSSFGRYGHGSGRRT